MFTAPIVITLADASLGARRYVFRQPEVCVVGREHDCDIQVPSDQEHLDISRHHCILLINPPKVCVRDLGSMNGTFVNGIPIGQHRAADNHGKLKDDTKVEDGATKLKPGDEVRLAKSTLCLKVSILDNEPPFAA